MAQGQTKDRQRKSGKGNSMGWGLTRKGLGLGKQRRVEYIGRPALGIWVLGLNALELN